MPTSKESLIRRPAVLQTTSLASSTLERLLVAGEFPAAVRVSRGTVAWRQTEVQQWIRSRRRVGRGKAERGLS
ncbi:AlpA family phage regulatory protein [Caballeronia sp. ATUFL_M2_KS44]|uniref:helix-turn-helix transcriptional regulator n=1 Tax=Caballeronia sp. ATUFL_M2_KS44 TaxID=2921767 RepID=UPI0032ED84A4